jgi:hypothetical protein
MGVFPLGARRGVAGFGDGKDTVCGVTAGKGQRPKRVAQIKFEVWDPTDKPLRSCARIGPSAAIVPLQTSASSACKN